MIEMPPLKEVLAVIKSKQEANAEIYQIHTAISAHPDGRIVLLRQKEVVQWLFGDTSFLPPIEEKNKTRDREAYKVLEDEWGRKTLNLRRPDLDLKKQWTNKFGEHICEELYLLFGVNGWKPLLKEHHQPDLEIPEAIVEAKAETFFTEGTAGEKILGCPFKYRKIPRLYGKPLNIVCMGGAEKAGREEYGILPGSHYDEEAKEFLAFYLEKRIEFIRATDLLRRFIVSE